MVQLYKALPWRGVSLAGSGLLGGWLGTAGGTSDGRSSVHSARKRINSSLRIHLLNIKLPNKTRGQDLKKKKGIGSHSLLIIPRYLSLSLFPKTFEDRNIVVWPINPLFSLAGESKVRPSKTPGKTQNEVNSASPMRQRHGRAAQPACLREGRGFSSWLRGYLLSSLNTKYSWVLTIVLSPLEAQE